MFFSSNSLPHHTSSLLSLFLPSDNNNTAASTFTFCRSICLCCCSCSSLRRGCCCCVLLSLCKKRVLLRLFVFFPQVWPPRPRPDSLPGELLANSFASLLVPEPHQSSLSINFISSQSFARIESGFISSVQASSSPNPLSPISPCHHQPHYIVPCVICRVVHCALIAFAENPP